MPSAFHGAVIGPDAVTFGEHSVPLDGAWASLRDAGTTTERVTASHFIGSVLPAVLLGDEIGWSLAEDVPTGMVHVVITGAGGGFEVAAPAAERRAAKEFVVAVRVAAKAARAHGT